MNDPDIPRRERFEEAYRGKPPWDIGRPQRAFVEAADQVAGSVLDSGCGTGEIALFFAARGHRVTGVDYLDAPIARAKQKAVERNLTANFLVMDALALVHLPEVFDTVLDCGLFHVFSDEDRSCYVDGLASVLKPGGKLLLTCFSDKEPGTEGPRRISSAEIHDAFHDGWHIESLTETRFEIRPDVEEPKFSEGGPHAWFAVIRRLATQQDEALV